MGLGSGFRVYGGGLGVSGTRRLDVRLDLKDAGLCQKPAVSWNVAIGSTVVPFWDYFIGS